MDSTVDTLDTETIRPAMGLRAGALAKYLEPFSAIPLRIFIRLSELHLFVVMLHMITSGSINAV